MSTWKSLAIVVIFGLFFPLTRAEASPSEMLAAGRVDDVIASLRAQLERTPSDAASHNYLCRAYLALHDWDQAISPCARAVSLEPGNSDYHLWLGRAYGEKADRSNIFTATSLARKVRRQLEIAVELNPGNVDARVDLAEFYTNAPGFLGGADDKVRAQASALAAIAPAQAHHVLGRLAEKRNDANTAEKEYRAAIAASGGNAHDWLHLALFYKHQNRLNEMEQGLQKAVNSPRANNEVMVESAEVLLRAGRNPRTAAQFVRRYLAAQAPSEKSPLFQAHYVLGTALEKQGDTQGAAREYRAALALASNFPAAKEALSRINQ